MSFNNRKRSSSFGGEKSSTPLESAPMVTSAQDLENAGIKLSQI